MVPRIKEEPGKSQEELVFLEEGEDGAEWGKAATQQLGESFWRLEKFTAIQELVTDSSWQGPAWTYDEHTDEWCTWSRLDFLSENVRLTFGRFTSLLIISARPKLGQPRSSRGDM